MYFVKFKLEEEKKKKGKKKQFKIISNFHTVNNSVFGQKIITSFLFSFVHQLNVTAFAVWYITNDKQFFEEFFNNISHGNTDNSMLYF